jgi:1-pyrroline-5-carboxylate dehydrogenase
MLGQSKTAFQAEIDSACELIDFWRFNVHFARQILASSPPRTPAGHVEPHDYRSLEGFVYAVTPFNFTAIAGNLPTAPALMGNTVVWKPAPTQQFAAHYTMELLEEAGMPPGVINMVTGHGRDHSDVALYAHPDLAGLHFTGSTRSSS